MRKRKPQLTSIFGEWTILRKLNFWTAHGKIENIL